MQGLWVHIIAGDSVTVSKLVKYWRCKGRYLPIYSLQVELEVDAQDKRGCERAGGGVALAVATMRW
jgi:hypothetical protein